MVCTGPITYKGHDLVKRDIENFKAALGSAKPEEAFMPAISPSNVEDRHKNAYYKTEEEFLFAIADALAEEYKAIVAAGFLIQVDDPRLVSYYTLKPGVSVADCQKWARTAHRRRQSRAARHPDREDPLPHLLQHQHGPAHP